MTPYFAYGANLDRDAMKHRCPDAIAVGPAVLAGYRFVIGSGGWGSVAPARGSLVHGVLWRITPRDRAALNVYEQVENGLYLIRTASVRAGNGNIAAMLYILRHKALGRPRPGYIDRIAAAARSWDFPDGYIREIERWSMMGRVARRTRETGEIA